MNNHRIQQFIRGEKHKKEKILIISHACNSPKDNNVPSATRLLPRRNGEVFLRNQTGFYLIRQRIKKYQWTSILRGWIIFGQDYWTFDYKLRNSVNYGPGSWNNLERSEFFLKSILYETSQWQDYVLKGVRCTDFENFKTKGDQTWRKKHLPVFDKHSKQKDLCRGTDLWNAKRWFYEMKQKE